MSPFDQPRFLPPWEGICWGLGPSTGRAIAPACLFIYTSPPTSRVSRRSRRPRQTPSTRKKADELSPVLLQSI
ncbi:hypothetical protein [Oscillatoria sp. HE19RPO]|uniref:hypothetical protein n=1 Tax=Oscillatoria sp. HE19RPO TaxID=2954806 RepID=UPI0020C545B8|nr:hypothetical protein [Oscillatoria sp. HE19RPO]